MPMETKVGHRQSRTSEKTLDILPALKDEDSRPRWDITVRVEYPTLPWTVGCVGAVGCIPP